MVGRAETLSAVFFLSAFFSFRASARTPSRGNFPPDSPVSDSSLTGFPNRFDGLVLDCGVSGDDCLLYAE